MHKGMTNNEIAELLRAVAASYELQDKVKNKFRIVAYERAADSVEHASSELKDLWDEGKLDEIAGIGNNIAKHLNELFKKGSSSHFEKVMKDYPQAVFELMAVPGIGAKTAYRLVKELGISNKNPLEELKQAAIAKKIEKLEGFGIESQKDIVKSIEEVARRTKRHLLPYALHIAEEIIQWLKQNRKVLKVDALGSLRRRASTVGDIDIAVGTKYPEEVIDHFTKYPNVQRVLEKGSHTASVVLPSGAQVDLMVQPDDSYGSLLQHFTGSKHHNIALRELALKQNLSLSEYGIKREGSGLIKFDDEVKFYNYLGLEWIPPELREDMGEIQAAAKKEIPKLVELKDIKADLQIHSDFNIETSHDLGQSSMKNIVDKANTLGYEYIAFTEHNPSHSRHSKLRIVELLKRKKEAIDKINTTYVKVVKGCLKKVFNSLEIDILPDGNLPVPEKGLELLDFALVSIHSSFQLPRLKMTDRIMNSFCHPKIKIFAHPTARLINKREGIELEWNKLFEVCKTKGIFLEINADPMRLDLPDFLVKEAIESGLKLSMGSDSHHFDSMDNMKWGVSVARRGWARKNNIVNTLTLEEFEQVIKY